MTHGFRVSVRVRTDLAHGAREQRGVRPELTEQLLPEGVPGLGSGLASIHPCLHPPIHTHTHTHTPIYSLIYPPTNLKGLGLRFGSGLGLGLGLELALGVELRLPVLLADPRSAGGALGGHRRPQKAW